MFQDKLVLDAKQGKYWFLKAWIHRKLDEYENVISSLSQAIELNPNKLVFYNYRREAYCILDFFSEGIKDFDKSIAHFFLLMEW